MKRTTLLLCLVSILPGCGDRAEVSRRFAELTAAAKPEESLCEKFSADRKKALAFTAQGEYPYHFASREDAMAALSLLEARPGTGPRTREAAAYFLDHDQALLTGWNPFRTLENRANSVTYGTECEPLLGLRVLPGLIASETRLKFTTEEKVRLKRALEHFFYEALEPNLGMVSLAIRGTVLKTYVESAYRGPDRAARLAEASDLMKAFEADRHALYLQSQNWLARLDPYTGASALRELAWRRKFNAAYEALLQQVMPRTTNR